MAVCAIASARARDGALFPGRWDPEHFKNPTSESFFAAAKEAIPQDLSGMRGLDWMRTCALMALYGIQVGRIEIMHQYLGLYHSLVAMDNLHDEKNWPKSGIVEVELRRRLVSSQHTLYLFISTVLLIFAVLVNVHLRSLFLHSLERHYPISRIPMQRLLSQRSRRRVLQRPNRVPPAEFSKLTQLFIRQPSGNSESYILASRLELHY